MGIISFIGLALFCGPVVLGGGFITYKIYQSLSTTRIFVMTLITAILGIGMTYLINFIISMLQYESSELLPLAYSLRSLGTTLLIIYIGFCLMLLSMRLVSILIDIIQRRKNNEIKKV